MILAYSPFRKYFGGSDVFEIHLHLSHGYAQNCIANVTKFKSFSYLADFSCGFDEGIFSKAFTSSSEKHMLL